MKATIILVVVLIGSAIFGSYIYVSRFGAKHYNTQPSTQEPALLWTTSSEEYYSSPSPVDKSTKWNGLKKCDSCGRSVRTGRSLCDYCEIIAANPLILETWKEIFYETVQLEDGGMDPDAVNSYLARKYNLSKETIVAIGIIGAVKRWPMPPVRDVSW